MSFFLFLGVSFAATRGALVLLFAGFIYDHFFKINKVLCFGTSFSSVSPEGLGSEQANTSFTQAGKKGLRERSLGEAPGFGPIGKRKNRPKPAVLRAIFGHFGSC